ncbi:HGxxPAAW family protein [Streptomyces sp. NPDC086077]|uniref:HGxxPAAW family protein n=1 Tax=Streptomyces sp. NPDC086077 TaxID=3154862 RepID=UPI00342DBE4A
MGGHQFDEGHTIAGWSGVAVATVGCAVLGFGVGGWRPGLWLGAGVVVVAALLTWGLHLAGWGKPPGPRPKDQWGVRVRDAGARAGHAGCLGCRVAGRRGARASVPRAFAVPAVTPATSAAPAPSVPASFVASLAAVASVSSASAGSSVPSGSAEFGRAE